MYMYDTQMTSYDNEDVRSSYELFMVTLWWLYSFQNLEYHKNYM